VLFFLDLDVICLTAVGFSFQRKGKRAISLRRTCYSMQQAPPPAWPGRAVTEPGRKSWDGPKPISIVGSTGSIGTQVNISSKDSWMHAVSHEFLSYNYVKCICLKL
jgi:hypothetical protein